MNITETVNKILLISTKFVDINKICRFLRNFVENKHFFVENQQNFVENQRNFVENQQNFIEKQQNFVEKQHIFSEIKNKSRKSKLFPGNQFFSRKSKKNPGNQKKIQEIKYFFLISTNLTFPPVLSFLELLLGFSQEDLYILRTNIHFA